MPTFLSSLLFAVFTTAATAASAAPATEPPAVVPISAPAVQMEHVEKINLNTANAETLQRELAGVGGAKAQAIVAYREANGDFASVDELLEVKGIGKAILERNLEKLSIN